MNRIFNVIKCCSNKTTTTKKLACYDGKQQQIHKLMLKHSSKTHNLPLNLSLITEKHPINECTRSLTNKFRAICSGLESMQLLFTCLLFYKPKNKSLFLSLTSYNNIRNKKQRTTHLSSNSNKHRP